MLRFRCASVGWGAAAPGKVAGSWAEGRAVQWATHCRPAHLPSAPARRPQFGTPEEDAHRRDFTINSMFYNINTGLIEDFTGQCVPRCCLPACLQRMGRTDEGGGSPVRRQRRAVRA